MRRSLFYISSSTSFLWLLTTLSNFFSSCPLSSHSLSPAVFCCWCILLQFFHPLSSFLFYWVTASLLFLSVPEDRLVPTSDTIDRVNPISTPGFGWLPASVFKLLSVYLCVDRRWFVCLTLDDLICYLIFFLKLKLYIPFKQQLIGKATLCYNAIHSQNDLPEDLWLYVFHCILFNYNLTKSTECKLCRWSYHSRHYASVHPSSNYFHTWGLFCSERIASYQP